MDYLTDVLRLFSKWMRDGLFGICMAIVATVLIVFGNDINRQIRGWIKSYPFVLRLVIFICVCAIGYGFVAITLAKGLAYVLSQMNDAALAPVVILLFAIIGFIAERKNHM